MNAKDNLVFGCKKIFLFSHLKCFEHWRGKNYVITKKKQNEFICLSTRLLALNFVLPMPNNLRDKKNSNIAWLPHIHILLNQESIHWSKEWKNYKIIHFKWSVHNSIANIKGGVQWKRKCELASTAKIVRLCQRAEQKMECEHWHPLLIGVSERIKSHPNMTERKRAEADLMKNECTSFRTQIQSDRHASIFILFAEWFCTNTILMNCLSDVCVCVRSTNRHSLILAT